MRERVCSALALAVVSVALVSGCTAQPAPSPSIRPTPSAEVSGPASPTATPAPTLTPTTAAAEALAVFDRANLAVVAADVNAGGRPFIDALVGAGFDRTAMQVTADTTTIGDPADSVQFSVLWNGECLVGQYGAKSGGYQSAVRPALGTGACLVGRTRPIDW